VGVSYWFTQNVKLGVSYRLDAFINVQNQDTSAVTNLTPDRYTHGPRVAVTGQVRTIHQDSSEAPAPSGASLCRNELPCPHKLARDP
jgi:hypothetical protein